MSSHNTGSHHSSSQKKGLHKDWRTWVVVVLMLGAMGTYVLTMDDSLVPATAPAQR